MSIKKIVFLLAGAIVFTACSLTKSVKPNLETVSYQMLLEHHAAWEESVKTLDGNLRITLDTPQYSGNFFASVLVNNPDSMMVTVTGPFGMHMGKVNVTRHSFIFYNQVMDQFLKGNKADFEGRNFLQFPLEIGQLKDVFIARDPFKVLHKKVYKVRDDCYYLEAQNGNFDYNIWFEPEHLLIKKIEYKRAGKILFYKEYDNYKKTNGIYFPYQVNFVKPDEKQGVSIIITQLELNQYINPNLYKIKISDSATQIDLTL